MAAAHDDHDAATTTTGPKVLVDKSPTATRACARSRSCARSRRTRRSSPRPRRASASRSSTSRATCSCRCKKLGARAKAGAPVDEKWKNEIETVQYPEEKVDVPGALPRPAPPHAARRRRGALRRVHVLPDGVPGALHHDHPRGDRRQGHREAARGVRDRRAALRRVRPVRRGVPVRRDPHGHRRCTRKPVEDRADAIETLESMMARGIRSTATQGGEGPNWREAATGRGPTASRSLGARHSKRSRSAERRQSIRSPTRSRAMLST